VYGREKRGKRRKQRAMHSKKRQRRKKIGWNKVYAISSF